MSAVEGGASSKIWMGSSGRRLRTPLAMFAVRPSPDERTRVVVVEVGVQTLAVGRDDI